MTRELQSLGYKFDSAAQLSVVTLGWSFSRKPAPQSSISSIRVDFIVDVVAFHNFSGSRVHQRLRPRRETGANHIPMSLFPIHVSHFALMLDD